MATVDIDDLIRQCNFVIVANLLNNTDPNCIKEIEDVFHRLVKETASTDSALRLNPDLSHVDQFLSSLNDVLSYESTSSIIRSRVLLIQYNLCEHNYYIRRHLASDPRYISIVYKCLMQTVIDGTHPQNLSDILRLLQYLTYERCFSMNDDCSQGLMQYLLDELCKPDLTECQPYCANIVVNLVDKSESMCYRITSSNNYLEFIAKLRSFLSAESRTLVISAFVLLMALDEQMRDRLNSPRYLKTAFIYIFDAIRYGETIITRYTAMTLCKRLIVSDSPEISVAPTLAATAKDVLNYGFFGYSVQGLASHLMLIDSRTEESLKLYELLLDICNIKQIRSTVCFAILGALPMEPRLMTPILDMVKTASMTFEESIDPEIPLLACELLAVVLKEAVDLGKRVQEYVPLDTVLQLISTNVVTPVETTSEFVAFQCKRISCGLKLANAIVRDEEAKNELVEIVTAPLCSSITESQLASNPIINFMALPPAFRNPDEVPSWSLCGVTILFELFKLLSSLKDYNESHEDFYWHTLRDARQIPILAYAICYGDNNIVHDALTFFSHCSRLPEFQTKLLSDTIAGCSLIENEYEEH